MLKCHDIADKASQFIDGELTVWQRIQYRLHLMMCHHCRRFINNFNVGIAMVKRLHKSKSQSPTDEQVNEICRHVHQHQQDR